MKKVDLRNFFLHVSIRCFDLNLPEKVISDARICESGSLNLMQAGGNDAILKTSSSQSSLFGGENVGRILSTWNIDMNKGNGGESGQLWILLLLFDRLSNWKLLKPGGKQYVASITRCDFDLCPAAWRSI